MGWNPDFARAIKVRGKRGRKGRLLVAKERQYWMLSDRRGTWILYEVPIISDGYVYRKMQVPARRVEQVYPILVEHDVKKAVRI